MREKISYKEKPAEEQPVEKPCEEHPVEKPIEEQSTKPIDEGAPKISLRTTSTDEGETWKKGRENNCFEGIYKVKSETDSKERSG